jgi:ATP-dependent DNA helicase
MDVVTDLPPKKEYVLYAPLTTEQKDLYQATLEKDVREYLMKKALDALEKDEEDKADEEEEGPKDDKRKLRKRTKPAAPAYLLEEDDDAYFDALERGDYDTPEETEEERRKKERDAAKKQTSKSQARICFDHLNLSCSSPRCQQPAPAKRGYATPESLLTPVPVRLAHET